MYYSAIRKLLVWIGILLPVAAQAFWVVNFGTARTLHKGRTGFAAGLGGQLVFLGQPRLTSGFFTIPHAGFRYGLAEKLDFGLRLAPIPLPFASVGPGFGVNLDAKWWLTRAESKVDLALVFGAGGGHLLIEESTRYAYSPNAAVLVSTGIPGDLQLTVMGRWVHLAIPTAAAGAGGNYVNIAGVSLGLKKQIREHIALYPEIGVYHYDGRMRGSGRSGPGFQWGLMLATSF